MTCWMKTLGELVQSNANRDAKLTYVTRSHFAKVNIRGLKAKKGNKLVKKHPTKLWFAQAGQSKWTLLPPAQQHSIEYGHAPCKSQRTLAENNNCEAEEMFTAVITLQGDDLQISVINSIGDTHCVTNVCKTATVIDLVVLLCNDPSCRVKMILDDDGAKVSETMRLELCRRLFIKCEQIVNDVVRTFRWKPVRVERANGRIEAVKGSWARYQLTNGGAQAICVAGVDKNWQGKTAYKAPIINLQKFAVVKHREVKQQCFHGTTSKAAVTYSWKPVEVPGVSFSPISYLCGSLQVL